LRFEVLDVLAGVALLRANAQELAQERHLLVPPPELSREVREAAERLDVFRRESERAPERRHRALALPEASVRPRGRPERPEIVRLDGEEPLGPALGSGAVATVERELQLLPEVARVVEAQPAVPRLHRVGLRGAPEQAKLRRVEREQS